LGPSAVNWNIVLASIAGISLLVGGIDIFSVMQISISERTHEIGLPVCPDSAGRGSCTERVLLLARTSFVGIIRPLGTDSRGPVCGGRV
jgi:hypothetical protein